MNTLERLGNFAEAVVRHVGDGMSKVDEEVYQTRLAVCENCEFLKDDSICTDRRCGCFVRLKARWRSEDCPRRKWPNPKPVSSAKTTTGCCRKRRKEEVEVVGPPPPPPVPQGLTETPESD